MTRIDASVARPSALDDALEASFRHEAQSVPLSAQSVPLSAQSVPLSAGLLERLEQSRRLPTPIWSIVAAALSPHPKDPELDKGQKGVHYGRVSGELFGAEGPRLADIRQGPIGDCYFLAALGALVANHPDAIRDMIRANGDQMYSVRFFVQNDRGRYEPVWIGVDDDLPVDSTGNLAYAEGADSDGDEKLELWVALIEKAYAVFVDRYGPVDQRSGYSEIGAGGHCDPVLAALTGKPARYFLAFDSNREFTELVAAADRNHEVTIETKTTVHSGWVQRHAYTVLGTYEENGTTMVVLRNPWGSTEPDRSEGLGDKDDGIFAVSAQELRKNTVRLSTNEPPNGWSLEVLRFRVSISGWAAEFNA